MYSYYYVYVFLLLCLCIIIVLFLCKCVLCYCHRVSTQLQLTNISVLFKHHMSINSLPESKTSQSTTMSIIWQIFRWSVDKTQFELQKDPHGIIKITVHSGTATLYWLEGPRFEPRWENEILFSTHPFKLTVALTHPAVTCSPVLLPGSKTAGAWIWPVIPFHCRG